MFNCSHVAVLKALKKLGITRKKRQLHTKEQCPIKVRKYLNEIKDVSKKDIVYIDETGIQGYIYREYGRALKGKKVYDKIAGKKYQKGTIYSCWKMWR